MCWKVKNSQGKRNIESSTNLEYLLCNVYFVHFQDIVYPMAFSCQAWASTRQDPPVSLYHVQVQGVKVVSLYA